LVVAFRSEFQSHDVKRATAFAACCIAIATPCFARAQPPPSGQADGADDQAARHETAPDTLDDQMQAEAPAQGPSADVDSAQGDAPSAQAVPDRVLGAWCHLGETYVLDTDHSATFTAARGEAPLFTGRWELESIVRYPNEVYLWITWSFGLRDRMVIERYYTDDPSFDLMRKVESPQMGRGFRHC
jgi:hypothetical protein